MKKRILWIDDDLDILESVDFILQAEGYDTQTLDSPSNIFDQILLYKPDLILMDINMGDYDGLEVCRNIKANLSTEEYPIILVSADIRVKSAAQYGAIGYMLKPFNIDLLLGIIEQSLSAKFNTSEEPSF